MPFIAEYVSRAFHTKLSLLSIESEYPHREYTLKSVDIEKMPYTETVLPLYGLTEKRGSKERPVLLTTFRDKPLPSFPHKVYAPAMRKRETLGKEEHIQKNFTYK